MTGKTALVLSAGGYFGAYQAGAWKALAPDVTIDLVVGASVGALNGWVIASGCSPEELEQNWLDPSTARDLTLHSTPGLRNGYFKSGPLLERAEDLFRRYQPVLPFGMVMTEVPRLRECLVQTPEITPQHLVASCSIPFVLPFVEIGGRRFTDGGLLQKLPIWAAVEMGATEIIAIDSLPNVTPWWVHAGCTVMRKFRPANKPEREVKITCIAPTDAMGTAYDAVIWKQSNVERWLRMGEQDATRLFALQ